MIYRFTLILLSSLLFSQVQLKKELSLMHSPSSIIVVGKDSLEAQQALQLVIDEFEYVESKISEWNPNSEISEINKMAGIAPVKVTPWVFEFIQRSMQISEITEGAFDLTWASMKDLWRFDGSQSTIPSKEAIEEALQFIDYGSVVLDPDHQTVFLPQKGMKLGTGGNGQGLGVDRAINQLKEKGIKSALVNASGDIYAYGKQSDGSSWQIGISNPLDKNKIFAYLPLNEMALTTAGNYEKFILYNGEKYSHLIDPRTGFPAKGVQSVSVYSPSTELSDALDTAFFILGTEVALDIANQLPSVECIIVDIQNEIHYSNGIQKNLEAR